MAPTQTTNKPTDDDESENDEDYVPQDDEPEDEMDVDDKDSKHLADGGFTLSAAKRKAVDEAFEELFGYKFGTRFVPKRKTRRVGEPVTKQEQVLVDIFGPSVAAELMATSKSICQPVKRVALPSSIQETITEVKKYAGKTITIQKRVSIEEAQKAQAKRQQEAAKPAAGIDHLLKEISGPGKLSTVAKTSADWDTFKTDTGLEEDLEKQTKGKNAYLGKKDFLLRVDERRFEAEKAQRDKERTARGK
jgi:hypothetical protein